jgi:hypothetical protein
MKKKFWLFGVMAAAFALSVTGCASTITAVQDIPAEQLCQLDLSTNYITVTSFDGDSVRWKKGIGGMFTSKKVDLPAGTHTLTGNYSDGSVRSNGMSVTFEFEANHFYGLLVKTEGGLFSKTMSFDIVDYTARYGRQVKR